MRRVTPTTILLATVVIIQEVNSWSFRPLRHKKELVSWIGRKASFLRSSRPHRDALETKIPVLFEDEQILAIDKPFGISHHDDEEGNPGILTIIRHQQETGLP